METNFSVSGFLPYEVKYRVLKVGMCDTDSESDEPYLLGDAHETGVTNLPKLSIRTSKFKIVGFNSCTCK